MASENFRVVHTRVVRTYDPRPAPDNTLLSEEWRRKCGCLRTSDKLKEILKTFPSAPPPTPMNQNTRVTADCNTELTTPGKTNETLKKPTPNKLIDASKVSGKLWRLVFELVHLVQLSVTATALALYYFIYCYMQLVYYTLRSALYFHNADGPMKITIGVVTITSLVVGFNLLIRLEKMIGML